MAVFKELVIGKDDDLKKMAKSLFWFSEELKFTISNLDEDNFSREFLDHETEKNGRVRIIYKDAKELQIRFENLETGTYGELNQSERDINLLVGKGEVVNAMLSRMRLYGEHIALTTGHVTLDTGNFTLDAEGNAAFTGNITGGTMKLGNGFAVDADGNAVIAGNLTCSMLNPKKGTIVGGDVNVEGDEGIGSATMGGTLTGADAFVVDSLSCRKVTETSDVRKKMRIEKLHGNACGLWPVSFRFRESGKKSMGFLAQETEFGAKEAVRKQKETMRIAYGEMGALVAVGIQDNQKRIDRIRKELKRREAHVIF